MPRLRRFSKKTETENRQEKTEKPIFYLSITQRQKLV